MKLIVRNFKGAGKYKFKRFIFKLIKSSIELLFIILTVYFLRVMFKVDPYDEISINSFVTKIIVIFLLVNLVSLLFIIKFIKKSFYSKFAEFFHFFAILIIICTSTVNILSIRGAPFIPGAIWGDLGANLKLAVMFQEDMFYTQVNGYPQLWFFMVGVVSNVLNNEVVYLYKTFTILMSIIFSYLSLRLWQAAFGKILGTSIILATLFNFILWRDFGHLMFIPIFVLLIKLIVNNKENKKIFKPLIHSNLLGMFFGIAMSLYYSNLYWTLVGFTILMIILSINTRDFVNLQCLFVINFLFGFMNFFLTFVNFEFMFIKSLAMKYILLTILNLIVLYLTFKVKLKTIYIRFFLLFLGLLLGISVILFRPLDYVIPDGFKNNPIFDPEFELDISGAIKFIIIYFGIFIGLSNKKIRFTYILIFTLVISAIITKYYFISQYPITGNVGLFDRADTILYHSWRIIEFISIGTTIKYIYIKQKSKFEDNKLKKYNVIVLALFLLLSISFKMSEVYIGTFPIKNETVRWAHEVCLSNFDAKTIFPLELIQLGKGRILENYIRNYCL